MPRKIKVVDVVENQIVVKTENTITDIPNDVIVKTDPIPEPELDSPVVIPDEVADEILKDDVKLEVNSNDSLSTSSRRTSCKNRNMQIMRQDYAIKELKICTSKSMQKQTTTRSTSTTTPII